MKGKYEYIHHRGHWRVIYFAEGSSCGTNISEYPTREEARREVYRLNGWRYKEPSK